MGVQHPAIKAAILVALAVAAAFFFSYQGRFNKTGVSFGKLITTDRKAFNTAIEKLGPGAGPTLPYDFAFIISFAAFCVLFQMWMPPSPSKPLIAIAVLAALVDFIEDVLLFGYTDARNTVLFCLQIPKAALYALDVIGIAWTFISPGSK